jgi:methylphosphotriester-DNA--protein-cysteine methyltransferase
MSERSGKTYVLIGRDGQPYASATLGTLGGHRRTRIYGTLDCPGARRWIARGHYVKHRVFFADEESAIAAGHRPCARCMPEAYAAWKTVHEMRHLATGRDLHSDRRSSTRD